CGDSNEKVIAVLALKSKLVLKMNDQDDVKDCYRNNKKDFAEYVNKVYDFMVEFDVSYGILSTYEYTWFIRKDIDIITTNISISHALSYNSTRPTLFQSFFYFLNLARNN